MPVHIGKIFLLFGCLLCARAAFAEEVESTRFTLENGLEVILERDGSAPRVAVSVSYEAGLRRDPRGYRGLAQLTTRLMSRGSRNLEGGDYARHLERVGATAIGTSIDLDHATFRVAVPSRGLATVLWLESDRMASMLERVDQDELDRQRAVLIGEHEARDRRSFDDLVRWVVTRRLYPENHPYRDAGNDDRDLESIHLDHVRWFFQRHYAPWNARLAIVGDFDVGEARTLVARYFGSIRGSFDASEEPPIVLAETPFQNRYVTYGWQSERSSMLVVWRTPPGSAADDAVLDIVAEALAGRPGSRLHQRLVRRDGLVSSVGARQWSSDLESLFAIVVSPLEGDSELLAIAAAVEEELTRLTTHPLSALELETAREACRARLLIRSQNLVERTVSLSEHGSSILRQLAEYDQVSAEDVAEVSARELAPTGRLGLFFGNWYYAPSGGAIIGDEVQR